MLSSLPADGQPDRPIRIVLVDDNPLTRSAVLRHLRPPERYTVVAEAADGAEAVEAVARHPADVVLMDLGVPSRSSAPVTGPTWPSSSRRPGCSDKGGFGSDRAPVPPSRAVARCTLRAPGLDAKGSRSRRSGSAGARTAEELAQLVDPQHE